jgi:hypothetical protein
MVVLKWMLWNYTGGRKQEAFALVNCSLSPVQDNIFLRGRNAKFFFGCAKYWVTLHFVPFTPLQSELADIAYWKWLLPCVCVWEGWLMWTPLNHVRGVSHGLTWPALRSRTLTHTHTHTVTYTHSHIFLYRHSITVTMLYNVQRWGTFSFGWSSCQLRIIKAFYVDIRVSWYPVFGEIRLWLAGFPPGTKYRKWPDIWPMRTVAISVLFP